MSRWKLMGIMRRQMAVAARSDSRGWQRLIRLHAVEWIESGGTDTERSIGTETSVDYIPPLSADQMAFFKFADFFGGATCAACAAH